MSLPLWSNSGAVVQVSAMCVASKCSVWWQVIGWRSIRQVPTPQVPACASFQSAPRYRPARRSWSSQAGLPM
ncbi:hypothetical protein ACFJIS_08645 [Variovorax boronicumulans]|uniref:hypothetical protein n=1 Tax=Variovorax boronicumulans TaxID=436515 RepID=UPI0036F40436